MSGDPETEMSEALENDEWDKLPGLIKKYPKLIDSTLGNVSTPTTRIAKRRGVIGCLGLGKGWWCSPRTSCGRTVVGPDPGVLCGGDEPGSHT